VVGARGLRKTAVSDLLTLQNPKTQKTIHSVCNAILLPVVQAYNGADAATSALFIDIADALGVGAPGMDGRAAVPAVLGAIKSLSADVGIPRNLALLGVEPQHYASLADNAMKDACGATNPRQPSREEVIELFKQACEQ
jgi:alcohol dehydrogenase